MKESRIVTWKAKIRISECRSTGKMFKVSPTSLVPEVKEVIAYDLNQGAAYGNIWVGYPGDYGDKPAYTWEARITVKDDGIPVHFYDLKAKVRERILKDLAEMLISNKGSIVKGYEKSKKAMRKLVKYDEYNIQKKRISKGRTIEDEIDLTGLYVP